MWVIKRLYSNPDRKLTICRSQPTKPLTPRTPRAEADRPVLCFVARFIRRPVPTIRNTQLEVAPHAQPSSTSPPTASSETIAAILDTEGALILDDVISPAQVAAVVRGTEPLHRGDAGGAGPVHRLLDHAYRRAGGTLAAQPRTGDASGDPGRLRRLSGCVACDRYRSASPDPGDPDQARPAAAGPAPATAWRGAGFLKGASSRNWNTIWALTEFTRENGATQVRSPAARCGPEWPASRAALRLSYTPKWKAGSVLVCSGSGDPRRSPARTSLRPP